MLHHLLIENFKALLGVEIALDRLTVVVGPNASGKTSLLEAINVACKAVSWWTNRTNPVQLVVPETDGATAIDPKAIRNARSDGPIRVVGDWDEGRCAYTLRPLRDLPAQADDVLPWEAVVEQEGELPISVRSVLARFEAESLAMPSRSDRFPPILPSRGYGLASVLAYMALNRPDDFQWVQQAIRAIVPTVRRIRFDRKMTIGPAPQPLDVLVFDMESGDDINARSVSEGTLLVLGLLASIAGTRDEELVLLVDDLDRGLHPRAQQELIESLRRFLDENPRAQVVATTHSPILLNYLLPEEVRLTALNADGTTACGRLTDHPAFEEWKDAMAPGEFWSYVGEQWVRDLPVGRGA